MRIWRSQSIFNSWKKLTSGSVNRQIFGAAIVVGIFTALVKVAAVVKELVVAWQFGTGDDLDAFLIALVVPTFVINVIAGSFNTALIPTYMQVREQEGTQAAQKLFSSTTMLGSGLLVATTLLMIAAAPFYLPLIAAGFDAAKLRLTFELLCITSPLVLLSGVITLWSAVLNAGERFALAAFSPILTPMITIVLLIAFSTWGAFALALGLVFGAVLEITLLGVALDRQGIVLRPRWHGFSPRLRQVAAQYLPVTAGGFLMCSTSLVDQSMAAMLPSGSVAALSYGNRVIAFPLGLATTALSTAVIPYFSKMVAQENWRGVRHTLKHYLWLISIVTVPFTGIFMFFSEFIVQALFQRGSFTSSDTHLVAQIQACFALQIPFYIASTLIVRLISAMQVNHFLLWGSACNLVINIALNYLLMQWLGVAGIALSTTVVYIFSFFFLWFCASRQLSKVT